MVLSDFCGSPGFFAPEMITKGAYYGDKADIWSTGCILLELILGHEKFCDVWMCAYDYDILQDKERFSESISQAVETLSPHLESFSPELYEFVSLFLKLRSSERPAIKKLLQHKWLEDFREELKSTTASFHEDLTVQTDGFDQLSVSPVPSGSPDPLTRIRLDSLDSPQRQPVGISASITINPYDDGSLPNVEPGPNGAEVQFPSPVEIPDACGRISTSSMFHPV